MPKTNLRGITLGQEIIKLKSVNPRIGHLTKVNPRKLFLGIVPSSSADITCVLRGQPKRLFQNYIRRNGGNVIVYVLV